MATYRIVGEAPEQFKGTEGASNSQFVAEAFIAMHAVLKNYVPHAAAEFNEALVAAGIELENFEDDQDTGLCRNCGYIEEQHTAHGFCTRGGNKGDKFEGDE